MAVKITCDRCGSIMGDADGEKLELDLEVIAQGRPVIEWCDLCPDCRSEIEGFLRGELSGTPAAPAEPSRPEPAPEEHAPTPPAAPEPRPEPQPLKQMDAVVARFDVPQPRRYQ